MPLESTSQTSPPRFAFLDALRGIAALGVLFHHLYGLSVMVKVYTSVAPEWVNWLAGFGAQGVQMFFVLSGFVIAHSLRANPLSRSSLGRFMLRRQLRLDPPYWVALGLSLGLSIAEHIVPGLNPAPYPTFKTIALHTFYLGYIFHAPKLLDVAWTLCLEIQFYLLFILVLALFQRPTTQLFFVTDHSQNNSKETPPLALSTTMIMWLSGALCIVTMPWSNDVAYFWTTWQYFVLGTLAYWAMQRKISDKWLGSFIATFGVGWLIRLRFPPDTRLVAGHVIESVPNSHLGTALIVGCLTALSLFMLGRLGRLNLGSNARVLQYLGRISYSLYLVHVPVIMVVMKLAFKLTGYNIAAAIGWFVFCTAACVGAAHLFYLVVEKPSLKWANSFKSNHLQNAGAIKEAVSLV